MQRKIIDIEHALKAKGFKLKEGDHHFYVFHTELGKKTSVFTKTSHSGNEADDYLLGRMAKQCRLTKARFLDLVDCPMSRRQYEAHLVDSGIVKVAVVPVPGAPQ